MSRSSVSQTPCSARNQTEAIESCGKSAQTSAECTNWSWLAVSPVMDILSIWYLNYWLISSLHNLICWVNDELLITYWKIGEIIVKYGQNEQIRATYGEKTLLQLSKSLTRELGKGFSRSNLQNMRAFYLKYPICQSVTGKLTWTHYCELLSISDDDKRSFYEKECINSGWSA